MRSTHFTNSAQDELTEGFPDNGETEKHYLNRGLESCKLLRDCSVCAAVPKLLAPRIVIAGVNETFDKLPAAVLICEITIDC